MTSDVKNIPETSMDITINDINGIFEQVSNYLNSLVHIDEDINQKWQWKIKHSFNVSVNAEKIATSLEMDELEIELTKLIGLMHDLGRFPQYEQYQTFNDLTSIDHGDAGADLIAEKEFIKEFDDEISNLIIETVRNHNKAIIPKTVKTNHLQYIKIIRDADKLDILEQAVNALANVTANKSDIFSEFEKNPNINEVVFKKIKNFKLPDKKDIVTVNDFKLFQMSYVFDLQHKYSFNQVNKKQYLKKIFDTMPKNDMAFEAFRKTKIHVENNLF